MLLLTASNRHPLNSPLYFILCPPHRTQKHQHTHLRHGLYQEKRVRLHSTVTDWMIYSTYTINNDISVQLNYKLQYNVTCNLRFLWRNPSAAVGNRQNRACRSGDRTCMRWGKILMNTPRMGNTPIWASFNFNAAGLPCYR